MGQANRLVTRLQELDDFRGPPSDGLFLKWDQAVGAFVLTDSMLRPLQVDDDGPTVTFDLAVSNQHLVVLGGDRTLAVTGDHDGQHFLIVLRQDGGGGRVVTWWAGVTWMTPDGNPPTLTADAGKYTLASFLRLGADSYLGFLVAAQA